MHTHLYTPTYTHMPLYLPICTHLPIHTPTHTPVHTHLYLYLYIIQSLFYGPQAADGHMLHSTREAVKHTDHVTGAKARGISVITEQTFPPLVFLKRALILHVFNWLKS